MSHRLDAATANGLIAAIYDCAFAPNRLPEVLGLLHRSLGFANAILATSQLPSGVVFRIETVGVPDGQARRLCDPRARARAPWAEVIAALPVEEPSALSRLGAARSMLRGRFYREWARPLGLTDGIGVTLAREEGTAISLIMARQRDAGPITNADVNALGLFIPHLRRSVAITRVLERQAAALSAFRQVIDALAAPILLVDRGSILVHANEAGRAALTSGDPLREEQGRLRLANPAVQGTLQQVVNRACGIGAVTGACRRATPVLHGDGRFSALHVVPLARPGAPGEGVRGLEGHPVCALLLSDCHGHSGATALAASAFGLTAAEAQVFAHIASGMTVSAAAEAIGVRPSTVRTHLLRLFNKTGSHRQVDLALLAHRLRGPLRE